jgi:hypothetical protein
MTAASDPDVDDDEIAYEIASGKPTDTLGSDRNSDG